MQHPRHDPDPLNPHGPHKPHQPYKPAEPEPDVPLPDPEVSFQFRVHVLRRS